MRKHLFVTLLLACGMPLAGNFAAYASPEPQSQSQSVVTVNGTILDENGEPVIGASVVQKGVSTNAAATDIDGKFALRVKPGTTLRVSYVGYKTVDVAAAEGMTVTLTPTTEVLNELVAVGYGSQKRANLTGAVATVDVAAAMESRPVEDVTRALQGAVPGLTITTTNGDFSSTPSIKIRGTGTLSNDQVSNPLIVVDGVPVDDMSFLNPDDIQDISVLKDASSSAVYGTRAAFGVILITTKGGAKTDRVQLSYSNNFSWNEATDYPQFANTVDEFTADLQSYARGFGGNEAFGMYYQDVLPYAIAWQQQHGGKKYTDIVELKPFESWDNVGDYIVREDGQWLRYADWDTGATLFQTAPAQKHNASIEGTSGKTNFRLSFGYDKREGLMRFSPEQMERFSVNASVTTEIFSWLKAGMRFNFMDRQYQSPNLQRNSYQYMWRFPSFFETYGYVVDPATNEPMYFRNEMGIRNGAHMDETKTNNTRMQGWLQANIIDGLTLQADFTYDIKNQNSSAAYTPFTTWNNWTSTAWAQYTNASQATTYAAQSNYRQDWWTLNVFATYQKTFAQDHNFKVMVGGTAESKEYNYFYAKRNGLTDYTLPNIDLTSSQTYSTSGSHTHSATAGFFGRINYDYKGIYLFEANGRYDASTKFPLNDQWAFFPSFSAGYRFSEEAYFADLKHIISNGKLRASYGSIGNEAIGSNAFIPIISQVGTSYVDWLVNGAKITQYNMPTLVSPSLTWERIVTTDVGLDLGFFDNELTFGFDWFMRENQDMLAQGATLPNTLGASAPKINAGTLRTNGWELSLGWNHRFGDVDVYATANLSDARSKVAKWSDASGIIYSYGAGYTEGTYYGDIWGFETDRYFEWSDIADSNGDGQVNMADQNADGSWNYVDGVADQSEMASATKNFHYGPGDVMYKDLNGDGVINNGYKDLQETPDGRLVRPGDEGYGHPDNVAVSPGTMKNHGDLKVIGNALPRYEYSFRLGASWNGFDIDAFFQGVGKRNMWATGSLMVPMAQSNLGVYEHQMSYNQTLYDYDEATGIYTVTGYEVDQNNKYPNMVAATGGSSGKYGNIGRGQANFYPQSKYLINMAYLRLKNLTIGYTLPKALTQKALISKARVYVSGENLFFLYNGCKDIHMDPEISQSYSGTSNDGVGGWGRTVPMMRSYSVGLQVTF